jgi:hypothetical protein
MMVLYPLPARTGVSRQAAEPGYWLVAGLDRPAEPGGAAVAVAPGLVPRGVVSRDAYQVLGCADLYATRHATRVVFLSDLARMFARVGRSWASVGVDWVAAVEELTDGPYPAMPLAITKRAHMLISDPAADPGRDHWHSQHELVYYERELVRYAITDKLAADWPAYAASVAQYLAG